MNRQSPSQISSRQFSESQKQPQFTSSPVVQPKTTKNVQQELPEWQPGGSGTSSLARLAETVASQAKMEEGKEEQKSDRATLRDREPQETIQQIQAGEGTEAFGLGNFFPSVQKKPDPRLPEWKPGGNGGSNVLARLLETAQAQAKLAIGEPNDNYEQEADRVARDVVQRINSPVTQTTQQEPIVRREAGEEGELQRKPRLQRREAINGGETSSELESSIKSAREGGQPLDAGLQQSMSEAMGADFSGVQVHTDGKADALNQSLQAKAFTTGQDVFFRHGEYQPGSRGGQELIAHELTHVVQQNGEAIRRSPQSEATNVLNGNIQDSEDKQRLNCHSTPKGNVIQRNGDDPYDPYVITQIVSTIGAIALFELYRHWPTGRTASDLLSLFRVVGFWDGIKFANFAAWNSVSTIALATNFAANPNGLTAAEWVSIAGNFPQNSPADATAFSQIPGWGHNAIVNLAIAFVGGANGLNAAQWATVAGRSGQNAHAEAIAFAQLANWTWNSINHLTTAFAANANNLSVANWVTVAGRVGNNAHTEAIAFARLANWTWNSIDLLTTDFKANANNLSADNWVTVAGRMGNNAHANTINFCQIPGWTWKGIDPLTQAFIDDSGVLNATQWITVAGRMANNVHADAIAFAYLIELDWNSIDPLTTAFNKNANNLTAARWITVAVRFADKPPNEIISLCQLANWNWQAINLLSQALRYYNLDGLTVTQWLIVAGRMGNNAHVNTIAFCQIPGWTWTGIDPLTTAFKANANNLSADNWVAVAGRMGDNAHVNTIAFCQTPGWTWKGIDLLITVFKKNTYGLNAKNWVDLVKEFETDKTQNIVDFLEAIQINNVGADFTAIATYLKAGQYGTIAELTTLLKSIAKRGTIKEISTLLKKTENSPGDANKLIQAIETNNKNTQVKDVTLLVNAVGKNGNVTPLTQLINSVAANGSIKEVIALLTTIEKYNKGTNIVSTKALVNAIEQHNTGTTIVQTTALINTVANHGTVAETTKLVNTVAGNSTIPELTALLAAIENHNAGTAIADTDKFIQKLNGNGNVCTRLTAIVNAVQNNGTVAEMTTMIAEAVTTVGAGHIEDLLTLINRNKKQNTPPRVKALLVACNPRSRVRFNGIVGKIPRFKRLTTYPNHGKRHYNGNGNVVNNGGTFTCDAWKYFYRRHSYDYFDFTIAANQNSMWSVGVNVRDELDNSIAGAIANGLIAAGGLNKQNGPNNTNEVGTVGVGGAINHLMPIGTNADDRFTQAEVTAIKDLK